MKQQKVPMSQRYPNRFKKVTLTFSESELYGLYTFLVNKVRLPELKRQINKAGGQLKFENHNIVCYNFEGEGCVVAVHNLAEPFMYKH